MTRPAPSTHWGHSKPPDLQEFLNPYMSEPQHPTRDLQAGIAQVFPLEKPLPTAASKWSPSDVGTGAGNLGVFPGFCGEDQHIPAGSTVGEGCHSPGI